MSRYKKVIDTLENTKAAIEQLLPSTTDEHHRIRLTANIQRDINYITLITRTGDIEAEVRESPGPATTIEGKPIERVNEIKQVDLSPRQERLQELRSKVDAAYESFMKQDNKFILKEYEDAVIRGVAKKAKMKVTKEEPEKITLAFIDEIKENILKMEELNEKREQERLQDQDPGKDSEEGVEDLFDLDDDQE